MIVRVVFFILENKKNRKTSRKQRETCARETERLDTRAHRTGVTATRLLKTEVRRHAVFACVWCVHVCVCVCGGCSLVARQVARSPPPPVNGRVVGERTRAHRVTP
jgi:hypothetical protein